MTYRGKKSAILEQSLSNVPSAPAMDDAKLFDFAKYDAAAAEKTGYSDYSYWRSTIRVFFKKKSAVFFLCLITLILLFSVLQPLLPGQHEPLTTYKNPETGGLARNLPPGEEFWFGTNSIGQDLWSQVWSGARTSLFIGFSVACIEAIVGIAIGLVWGYVRKLDFLFTELYNIFDNVPQTIILILISYILHPSVSTLILGMCLTSWLQMSRFVRNQIIIIRDRDYNLASRCLGTSTPRLIFKNLLPYLVSVIMLRMALAIPAAIGNEVFLTYIGLGLPVSVPSLGNLINAGRELMMSASLRYQLIFPTIALSLVTISFYIVGNSFADAADPKNHV